MLSSVSSTNRNALIPRTTATPLTPAKGEECVPSSWDIFFENFGWMLCWWNAAGVPLVYVPPPFPHCVFVTSAQVLCTGSLPVPSRPRRNASKSLHRHPCRPHPCVRHALLSLHFCNTLSRYYIFDTANSQKNRFRMMMSGTYIPRSTFPQLPWGTIANPK